MRRHGRRKGPLLPYFAALGIAATSGLAVLPSSWGWIELGMSSDTRGNLGSSLIGGAVVGMAVLAAETSFARRLDEQGMRMQLGSGDRFVGIDLRGMRLRNFYLPDRNFSRARMEGIDLSSTNASNSVFELANLDDARLPDVDLSSARLSGATLRRADLTDANLTGSSFAGAVLAGANLTGAFLTSADFSEAFLRDACLRSADLSETDFSGATLTGADFSGATWTPDAPPRCRDGLPVTWAADDPPTWSAELAVILRNGR